MAESESLAPVKRPLIFGPMKTSRPKRCAGPGCPAWVVQKPGRGRVARFCSDACRARARRWKLARSAA